MDNSIYKEKVGKIGDTTVWRVNGHLIRNYCYYMNCLRGV